MPVVATANAAAGTVTVVGTSLVNSPVSVSRVEVAGGASTPVRGGTNLALVAGGFTLIDREAPFGVDLVYRATNSAGVTVSSSTVRLDTGGPILSHPGVVDLQAAVRIVRDDVAWAGRSVTHDIINRRDPVVTAAPLDLGGGSITVYVDDVPAGDALVNVAADGWPLLLRTPCGHAFRDGYLAISSIVEHANVPAVGGRSLTLTYRRVLRPVDDPFVVQPWRLMDVDALRGTLAEIDAAYSTLSQVDAGPPT